MICGGYTRYLSVTSNKAKTVIDTIKIVTISKSQTLIKDINIKFLFEDFASFDLNPDFEI